VSKPSSYQYTGTKGYIVQTALNLPANPNDLLKAGWEDISHPKQAANGSHTYKDPDTGLRVRFDEPVPGSPGFAGKGHYHILNPNATNSKDAYLDKDGNPVSKNSKESHIMPKEENS